MKFNRICMIGLGYIGLPTAAVFASRKVEVVGVDVSDYVVDKINQGEIHIVEAELDILVRATVKEGYLRATKTPEKADAFIVAVPTPFKGENHEPDLSYIESAARSLAPVLERGNLVVLESTSPVGATEQMADWLAKARPDLTFPQDAGEQADIRIAHCPERVLPGQVIRELVQNDRVIGGMTQSCTEAATDLYRIFVAGDCVPAGVRAAELSKLTENAFRDVNIAFANELSMVCDQADIDVWEVIRLANRHPRVNILQPGCGVGGHCIAVDPWFIVNRFPEQARLMKTARQVNDNKPRHVVSQVRQVAMKFKHPVIACLGLAFKPNIDDLRESPAIGIIEELAGDNFRLDVVEPNIESLPKSLAGRDNVRLVGLKAALSGADIVVVLVRHKEFVGLEVKMGQLFFDFVNV